MKIVRLENNCVAEVIPEYALPVTAWYGEDFAKHCVPAPDFVEQRWKRNADDSWSEPAPYAPSEEHTNEASDNTSVWDALDTAYRNGVDAI